MRNDAFYADVSAVLPLLTAATMLALRSGGARSLREIETAGQLANLIATVWAGGRSLRCAILRVTAGGVGEVAALGARSFGIAVWCSWLFGPSTALCTPVVPNHRPFRPSTPRSGPRRASPRRPSTSAEPPARPGRERSSEMEQ